VVVGIVVLIGIAAGKLMDRKADSGTRKRWQQAAETINGAADADGVRGVYQGRPVEAKIVVGGTGLIPGAAGAAQVLAGGAKESFAYELRMTVGADGQGEDWWFDWRAGTADAKDPARAERVNAAGVASILQNWSAAHDGRKPEIRYDAEHAALTYRATDQVDVRQSWGGEVKNIAQDYVDRYPAPSPEQFRDQLDLLSALAQVNAQANSGSG
jgi:hypothetical protein